MVIHPSHDESLQFDAKVRTWNCANAEGWLNCHGMKQLHVINGQTVHEPSSVCLRAMVDEFVEMEASFNPASVNNWWHTGYTSGFCCCNGAGCQFYVSPDSASISTAKEAVKELDSVLRAAAASVDGKLVAHVATATKEAAESELQADAYAAARRRLVLKFLKRAGYNAGICKSEGTPINGIPLDGHEYVDVIMEEGGHHHHLRAVVDVGFPWHFKIARPSPVYEQLVRMLPENFVGSPITLQRVVRVMCQAAKESLESQGMPVPPWRRLSFMHAKWYSPHSRISSLEEEDGCTFRPSKTKMDNVGPKAQKEAAQPAATIPKEELWLPPPVNLSPHKKMGSSLAMAIMEARST